MDCPAKVELATTIQLVLRDGLIILSPSGQVGIGICLAVDTYIIDTHGRRQHQMFEVDRTKVQGEPKIRNNVLSINQ